MSFRSSKGGISGCNTNKFHFLLFHTKESDFLLEGNFLRKMKNCHCSQKDNSVSKDKALSFSLIVLNRIAYLQPFNCSQFRSKPWANLFSNFWLILKDNVFRLWYWILHLIWSWADEKPIWNDFYIGSN